MAFQELQGFPKPRNLDYLWADYIEIMSMADADHEYSRSELISRMKRSSDLGSFDTIDHPVDRETSAEENDNLALLTEGWFRHLEYREGAFGDCYPFSVTNSGDTLICNVDLNDCGAVYIFLLLCSNLRYLPRSERADLTSQFEVLSTKAVSAILPEWANVHLFEHSKGSNHYTGGLPNRIETLANDLNEQTAANLDRFDTNNYGDDGLDIVAWVPIDSASGIPILFGQCACTLKWTDKQRSSSNQKWRERVTMKAPSTNMVLVPYCYRTTNGGWYKPSDIVDSIMFDRLRIIRNVDRAGLGVNDALGQAARQIVNQAVQYTAPVF
ncbi:hypothetical protein [Salinibacter altiplanensis]|uniref:hypothetical protein n=1 Tax=Salinibacter altiplanensis TaxID=1803181 RepID=UPI00131A4FF0|nr:hypothetical protein [Salinibacter altiplanensis]